MAKFRKKPVVAEAEQYLGPYARPIPRGVCLGDGECMHSQTNRRIGVPHVTTAQGQHVQILPGEWVIQESIPGLAYPCKPDIFSATYEPVEE